MLQKRTVSTSRHILTLDLKGLWLGRKPIFYLLELKSANLAGFQPKAAPTIYLLGLIL
jgi:hypothetical protein